MEWQAHLPLEGGGGVSIPVVMCKNVLMNYISSG